MEREEICKKYLSYGQFPLTLNTWNALSSSECVSCSVVSNSVTPQTVAHHVPLSMGFSRQEYWSGLPFPSPGDLPNWGSESASPAAPALAGRFFTLSHTGSSGASRKGLIGKLHVTEQDICTLPYRQGMFSQSSVPASLGFKSISFAWNRPGAHDEEGPLWVLGVCWDKTRLCSGWDVAWTSLA